MEETGKGLVQGNFIGSKFKLEEQIGRGSFGLIWKCLNQENQEQYAVKFEKRQAKQSSMLVREIKVMIEMKEEPGFSRLISYGKDEEHNYVVMSYMGRNMDSILKKCTGKFSTQTLCNVSQQMITRLEQLHSKNLIHRDIKPDNYVIGHGNNINIVHLIDFGLAKYYKDSEGNHIPFIKKRGMIGTARYASTNAHLGHEQSRRDDLEGLGYVLLYFAKGKLPWQNIYAESKEEKYEKIKNMKQNQPLEQMCENAPSEFILYFKHVKSLGFTDTPDYTYLKSLFKKILSEKGLEATDHVDWLNLQEYKYRKKKPTLIQAEKDKSNAQKQSAKTLDQNKKQTNNQPNNTKTTSSVQQGSQKPNTNQIQNLNKEKDKDALVSQTQTQTTEQVQKKQEIQKSKQDSNTIANKQINDNKNNNISNNKNIIIENKQMSSSTKDDIQQIKQKSQPNNNNINNIPKPPEKKKSLSQISGISGNKFNGKRSSLLQPQQGQQSNTLQLPGVQSSLLNAIGGSSVYSQTAQYSIQGDGGGQSWGTKVNQYIGSSFSDGIIDNEIAPDLKNKMGSNLASIGDIKFDIKRKSAQMSSLDFINQLQDNKQNSQVKRNSFNDDEAIQEEGHAGSYIGENLSSDKQTIKPNRKQIQVLQIQSSYKNNEDIYYQK